MKHTPGPWTYGKDDYQTSHTSYGASIYVEKPYRPIADVRQNDDQYDDFTEAQANARLIHAAPLLLKAAEAMYTQVGSMLEFGDRYNLSPMVKATLLKCLHLTGAAIAAATEKE